MKTTVMNPVKGFTLFALGLAIAAMGIYVADADDAPGAAEPSGSFGAVLGKWRILGSSVTGPSNFLSR